MVEYQLIDSYVAELRGRLRWHREVDDLVAEVADHSGLVYAIGDIALLTAGILMLIAMVAIDQRHGGLGSRGSAGTVLVGIGVVASLAAWVFIGWGLLMLVGAALFAAAMLDARVAPRWGTLLFGVGPAAGAVAWAALRAIDDSLLIYSGLWGDYWTANLAGISIGSALLAVGLLSLGRWLRGERPAEIGTPGQALRA